MGKVGVGAQPQRGCVDALPLLKSLLRLRGRPERGEARTAEEQRRSCVGPALQHLPGSDLVGASKARDARRQSWWPRSSGPLLPPYPSPPARDLRPPSRTHGGLAPGKGGDVKGIPLSSRPRASRSFPRVCGAHSPPPPPQTRSPEPTRICLGAHDPSRST
nr:vacuolar protein sorting-associated protein 37C-like isoform X2 [Saimiri boliviensis boliviensis]